MTCNFGLSALIVVAAAAAAAAALWLDNQNFAEGAD
jgi:hypothetical protein